LWAGTCRVFVRVGLTGEDAGPAGAVDRPEEGRDATSNQFDVRLRHSVSAGFLSLHLNGFVRVGPCPPWTLCLGAPGCFGPRPHFFFSPYTRATSSQQNALHGAEQFRSTSATIRERCGPISRLVPPADKSEAFFFFFFPCPEWPNLPGVG